MNLDTERVLFFFVSCVISSLCLPNLEDELINPTSQASFIAFCLWNCSSSRNINWNIYQGKKNSSSSASTKNFTQWTQFNPTNLSFFFGQCWSFSTILDSSSLEGNSDHFTVDHQLFLSNLDIDLCRFEVVYSFPTTTSSSALNFLINRPPSNGSCSISPRNGRTLTLFSVSCPSWFDEDGIKDSSLFTDSNDSTRSSLFLLFRTLKFISRQVKIFDWSSEFEINAIVGQNGQIFLRSSSKLNPMTSTIFFTRRMDNSPNRIHFFNSWRLRIRIVLDKFFRLSPMNRIFTRPFQVRLLLSRCFSVFFLLDGGIPAARISISSLDSRPVTSNLSSPWNVSALEEFEKDFNRQANLREYLIQFLLDLPVTNSWNTIPIQSKSLVELTRSTNQLSRSILVRQRKKDSLFSLDEFHF